MQAEFHKDLRLIQKDFGLGPLINFQIKFNLINLNLESFRFSFGKQID